MAQNEKISTPPAPRQGRYLNAAHAIPHYFTNSAFSALFMIYRISPHYLAFSLYVIAYFQGYNTVLKFFVSNLC